MLDVGNAVSLIQSAVNAVGQANKILDDIKDAGLVLASDKEELVENAIAELEALLPELRNRVQNKLRGTSTPES